MPDIVQREGDVFTLQDTIVVRSVDGATRANPRYTQFEHVRDTSIGASARYMMAGRPHRLAMLRQLRDLAGGVDSGRSQVPMLRATLATLLRDGGWQQCAELSGSPMIPNQNQIQGERVALLKGAVWSTIDDRRSCVVSGELVEGPTHNGFRVALRFNGDRADVLDWCRRMTPANGTPLAISMTTRELMDNAAAARLAYNGIPPDLMPVPAGVRHPDERYTLGTVIGSMRQGMATVRLDLRARALSRLAIYVGDDPDGFRRALMGVLQQGHPIVTSAQLLQLATAHKMIELHDDRWQPQPAPEPRRVPLRQPVDVTRHGDQHTTMYLASGANINIGIDALTGLADAARQAGMGVEAMGEAFRQAGRALDDQLLRGAMGPPRTVTPARPLQRMPEPVRTVTVHLTEQEREDLRRLREARARGTSPEQALAFDAPKGKRADLPEPGARAIVIDDEED